MDNIMNRRKWHLSWKSAFLPLAALMLISTSANSTSISESYGDCYHDFTFLDLREISCYRYTEFPTNIDNPGEVTSLDMGRGNTINVLTNFSIIRANLTSLKILNLEYCEIREVESGAFSGTDELMHIYLNNNLITVLNPEIFTHVQNLRYLYLENNPITIIEPGKIFPNLPKLVTLDLSNCRLNNIPTNVFDNLHNLQSLNLSGNPLKHLNLEMLRSKSNLMSLNLEGNQWHCDCYSQFLLAELKKLSSSMVFENITCTVANMSNMKGDQNTTCHPEKFGIPYNSQRSMSPHFTNVNNGKIHRERVKHLFKLGEDVYFECKYSGVVISDYEHNTTTHDELIPTTKPGKNQSRSLVNDKGIYQSKVGEILVVRRTRVKDKGTYTCILYHRYGHALKAVYLPRTNIPGEENGKATLAIWIFGGLTLVVSVAVIAGIKRYKRRISQPTFGLGEFNSRSTTILLTLGSEDTDTSRI